MEIHFKGELLRNLVEEAQRKSGKTQLEILAEIGITGVAFWRYTTDGKNPDVISLSKIARYFGLSRDAFFDDSDGGNPAASPSALADVPQKRGRRRGRIRVGEEQLNLLSQEIKELKMQLSEVVKTLSRKIRVQLRERFAALWVANSVAPIYA
ncbi:helix-turn-helix domain-containing protein [Rhodoflexus sp.]